MGIETIGVSMVNASRHQPKGGKTMEANNASLLEGAFVNRAKELEVIDEVLGSAANRSLLIKKPILEFWGISGIGKSFLLMRIMELCNKQKLKYIFLDFDERKHVKALDIISEIAAQLQISNSEKSYLSALEAQLNLFLTNQIAFNAVESAFIQLLQNYLKQHPLILIFDTMEEVLENKQFMRWFTDTVDQLIDQGKMVVIFTSKRLVNFTERININRRLYDYQLKPFGQQDTKAQLSSIKKEGRLAIPIEISDKVFDLSAGHPLVNKYLINVADSKAIRKDDFHKHIPELLDSLEIVFDEWILQGKDNTSKAKYKALLTTLAVPRQFNLRIMEKLLKSYNSKYALSSSLAYIDLVNEIRVQTSLVDWDFYKSAYTVDITIRKILNYQMQVHHQKTYLAINKAMAEIYKEWIKQVSGFDLIKYLLELIYHTAIISKPTESAVSLFANYVEKLFADPAQYDERNRLKEQLAGDTELITLVGDSNFQKMFKIAEFTAGRG